MLNKASGLHVTQQLQPSRHSFSYILYLRQSLCWEEIHVQGLPSAIKSTKRRQPASNDFKERTDLFRQLRLISSRRTVPAMAPVFYRLMMIVILAFLTGQCRGRNPFWFRPTPKRDQQYYQCKYRGQLFFYCLVSVPYCQSDFNAFDGRKVMFGPCPMLTLWKYSSYLNLIRILI